MPRSVSRLPENAFDIKKHIKLSMALEELIIVMRLSVQMGVGDDSKELIIFKPYNPEILGTISILSDGHGLWIKRSDLKDFE